MGAGALGRRAARRIGRAADALLRFGAQPDGSRVEEHTDHDIATGSDLSSSTWADSLWALPWRTTGDAALLGSAPGALKAHCEAQPNGWLLPRRLGWKEMKFGE